MSQQPSVVYVQRPSNSLGMAGFIISLFGWLSCGILCPIGLILSLLGLRKEPRGFALAGVILGGLGCIWGVIAFFLGGLALVVGCGGALCGGVAPHIVTNVRMNMLANDVEKFQEKNGRMPDSVAEAVSARKRDRGEGKDAWGRAFRIEVGDNGHFSIVSDGPDGQPGTPDDIRTSHSDDDNHHGKRGDESETGY